MSGCERLSDRIPAVALGRSSWTAAETAHLESCADCRAEWELVLAAGRLGARAPRLQEEGALAARVLRRLAEEPAAPARRWKLGWTLGLAAAAAIALAVGLAVGRDAGAPARVAAGEVVETTAPLSTAQVDSLLDEELGPLAGWSMLDSPTLGDLTEDELERVLRTWEG